MRLRKHESSKDKIEKCKRTGKPDGKPQVGITEQPADCRAQHKAEPKCRADEAHAARSIPIASSISHICLRGRYGPRAGAMERTRGEQDRERIRKAIEEIAHRRA